MYSSHCQDVDSSASSSKSAETKNDDSQDVESNLSLCNVSVIHTTVTSDSPVSSVSPKQSQIIKHVSTQEIKEEGFDEELLEGLGLSNIHRSFSFYITLVIIF